MRFSRTSVAAAQKGGKAQPGNHMEDKAEMPTKEQWDGPEAMAVAVEATACRPGLVSESEATEGGAPPMGAAVVKR
jgi:hypothetical protein